jgi:hypothetical protein
LIQTYKPTSDGSVAAITAGGRLHTAAKFGTTEKSMSRRDMIAIAAIRCELQNASSFDKVFQVVSVVSKSPRPGGLAKSQAL